MRKNKVYKRNIKKDYQAKKLNNPFFRKKEKKVEKSSVKKFKIFSLILLMLFLVWFFLMSSWWNISKIEVSGVERIGADLIKDDIQLILNDSTALFSINNIFIFNKKTIAGILADDYNFSNVSIKKRMPNRIIIEVIERPYSYIYSENGEYYFSSAENVIMGKINFVDNAPTELELIDADTISDVESLPVVYTNEEKGDGVADMQLNDSEGDDNFSLEEGSVELQNGRDYIIATEDEKNKYFIIENKNSTSLIRPSNQIRLSDKYMEFITSLEKELEKQAELPLDRFIIADQYFNSVFAVIVNGPQIYFNVNREVSDQVEHLLLVKNQKMKDKFFDLEYIDLRYGDRIYYYPDNLIE